MLMIQTKVGLLAFEHSRAWVCPERETADFLFVAPRTQIGLQHKAARPQ